MKTIEKQDYIKRANARVAIRNTGVILNISARTIEVLETWMSYIEDYYISENKMDLFDEDILSEELQKIAFKLISPNAKVATIRFTILMNNRTTVLNTWKIYKKDLVEQ